MRKGESAASVSPVRVCGGCSVGHSVGLLHISSVLDVLPLPFPSPSQRHTERRSQTVNTGRCRLACLLDLMQ